MKCLEPVSSIPPDRFVEVDYYQFKSPPWVRWGRKICGAITWPVTIPLAFLARFSPFIFRSASEMLAIVPYLVGDIVRYEFYRWALVECGENVSVGFGTIFYYRDVRLGSNICLGCYNTLHYCDIGSYVLIADKCSFLSGSQYHNHNRTDIPMALQGGKLRRIRIGDDCWIGINSVIMNDVEKGSIVGANSVVTKLVEPYSIVAGNPARLLKSRLDPLGAESKRNEQPADVSGNT